jgi:hypothetical protein
MSLMKPGFCLPCDSLSLIFEPFFFDCSTAISKDFWPAREDLLKAIALDLQELQDVQHLLKRIKWNKKTGTPLFSKKINFYP